MGQRDNEVPGVECCVGGVGAARWENAQVYADGTLEGLVGCGQ